MQSQLFKLCLIIGSLIVALVFTLSFTSKRNVGEKRESRISFIPIKSTSHYRATAPLPPKAEPLTAVAPTLIMASNAGNREAAIRLFRDLSVCLANKNGVNFVENLESDPDWKKSPDAYLARFGVTTPEEKSKWLARIQERADRLEAYRDMCKGAEAYFDNGKIYGALEAAAVAGDPQATACMIGAFYDGPPLSTAEAADYRNTAYRLGDREIRAGSWASVQALALVHSTLINVGGYIVYVQQTDKKSELQYTELLLKGVSPGSPGRKALQTEVEALSAKLDTASRVEAEQWAEDKFRKYFLFSGEADPNSSLCPQ